MRKTLIRVVAVALIPCLLTDTSFAAFASLTNTGIPSRQHLSLFQEQALTAEPLGEQHFGNSYFSKTVRRKRVGIIGSTNTNTRPHTGSGDSARLVR